MKSRKEIYQKYLELKTQLDEAERAFIPASMMETSAHSHTITKLKAQIESLMWVVGDIDGNTF